MNANKRDSNDTQTIQTIKREVNEVLILWIRGQTSYLSEL